MVTLDYATVEAAEMLSKYEKLKGELESQMTLWEEATEVLLEFE